MINGKVKIRAGITKNNTVKYNFRANIVGKMISEQASIEAKVDSQLAFERFSAMLKGPTTRSNQLDSMLSNINLEDNAQLQLVIQKLMLKLNKNIENRTQSDLTITIDKKVVGLNFKIQTVVSKQKLVLGKCSVKFPHPRTFDACFSATFPKMDFGSQGFASFGRVSTKHKRVWQSFVGVRPLFYLSFFKEIANKGPNC